MSVPTTVNVLLLSSPPPLVIEGLFPDKSTNAAKVPTFTPEAAAFEAIWVTVLNILVEVTVPFAVGPVIVSLSALPSTSVPVIVKDTPDRLFVLETVIREFKLLDAAPACAPSIVKFPELPLVSLSTSPSESEAVTELPLRVNAVLPVPDCVVPMLSASVVPTNFKNPSKLLPMEFIAIDDELPVDDEDIE